MFIRFSRGHKRETTDLEDGFASGLSAQALESDNLGLNVVNF